MHSSGSRLAARLVVGAAALTLVVSALHAQPQIERCRTAGGVEFTETSALIQSTQLNARAGRPCRIPLIGGAWTNPRIETPPASGTVEFERDGLVFRPNDGFVGEDRFVASWYTPASGQRVMVSVAVRVTGSAQSRSAAGTDSAFMLRQILARWEADYRSPRYQDVVLHFRVQLNANGTLAAPWRRTDTFDPQRLIQNYQELQQRGQQETLRLVETFAQALIASQPYQLPPAPGRYPRIIELEFRLGDL
jgi:hypothetical protein